MEKSNIKGWIFHPLSLILTVTLLGAVLFVVLKPKEVTPESVFTAMYDEEESAPEAASIAEIKSISTEFGENRVK